jgi:hypothetical protein
VGGRTWCEGYAPRFPLARVERASCAVPSRSEERLEVTAYDPPRHLEIRGQLGPFLSRLSYALDGTGEGTRVTNSVELELRGPGRLLGRVAVPRVRDAVAANLRKLKELLEG